MAYTLEAITQADQEKIIQDAAGDSSKQSRLTYALSNRTFPRVWAVDRERNCYLFTRPAVTTERWRELFCFCRWAYLWNQQDWHVRP